MTNPLISSDDDEYESSRLASSCWWRSDAKFDECVKMKLDFPKSEGLTPRLRVLRELERLALVCVEGLNELRHKLLIYRSGDFWVPTGGISKENMDIPPVVTILLVGFSGSGKSSLVNLMYNVFCRSGLGLVPIAHTSSGSSSGCTTLFLEEHNVVRSSKSGFCVYDSRGLDYDQMGESFEDLSTWMSEGVRHNQPCLRASDDLKVREEIENHMSQSSSKFVKRKVNFAMLVVNMEEIYTAFKAGDSKPLEATRKLYCSAAFSKCIESPILILTHGDMLSNDERIDARLKICEYIGVSETSGVYDIVCLIEFGFRAEESDPISAYALTEAVYRALLISDRSYLPKRNLQDWSMLILSWLMCFFADFFAFLAEVCSKFGHNTNTLKQ